MSTDRPNDKVGAVVKAIAGLKAIKPKDESIALDLYRPEFRFHRVSPHEILSILRKLEADEHIIKIVKLANARRYNYGKPFLHHCILKTAPEFDEYYEQLLKKETESFPPVAENETTKYGHPMELWFTVKQLKERWRINTPTLLHFVTKGLPVYDSGTLTRLEVGESEGLLAFTNARFPAHYIISHNLSVFKLSDIEAFEKKHSLRSFGEHERERAPAPQLVKTDAEQGQINTTEKPLHGYKEIGEFLGVRADTIKKTYKPQGAPIYTDKKSNRVYAYPTDLNRWKEQRSKKNRKSSK